METFNDPSKRKELFTQRHNITFHKSSTFITKLYSRRLKSKHN